MKNNCTKKLFEMNKFFSISFFVIASFFLAKDVFAMDIPVFSLIVSENSSGYVCSGDSIGCSSLSSIYKIEKRGENLYICPSGSISCSPLSDSYKTKIYDEDTTYICLGSSFGCGSLSALYKLKKYDEYTTYVCSGNSIGCSSLSALYKLKKYDEYTTYACSGDSIGCSSLSAIYKFKKTDTQSSGYSGINYSDQIKIEQDKLAQLEQEKQKLTENYLNALNNLNTPQYTCPANSTLNGTTCPCNDGYVSNGSACITYTQSCQTKYGVNSYGDKNSCTCTSGYVIYNNQCILGTEYCRLNYGDHTLVKMINGTAHCDCEAGYIWNSNITACIKTEVKPIIPLSTTKPATQDISDSKKETPKIAKSEEKEVETKPIIVSPIIKPVIQETSDFKEVAQKTTKPVEKLIVKSESAQDDTLTTSTSEKISVPEEKVKKESKAGFFVRIFESIKNFFSKIFR